MNRISKSKHVPGILVFLLIAIPVIALLASVLIYESRAEEFSYQITIPAIIGLLLIVTTGLLISFILWEQWRRFYNYRHEAEEAEAAIERSNSLLKATIESTADGLLVVDVNSKVVLYNSKFAEMWKIPGEILQKGEDKYLLEYVMPQIKNPEVFLEGVRILYNDPSAITNDIIDFADGRCFERYSQPQVINGVSVGRVWSFRDVTDKKKAEKELIDAKERAEESDRLKTSFLHNVSHEIRTPMNAIMGFSTLLNDKNVTEQERCQYAGIISQSSSQLLSIINDIVDIANIESGQVRPNISEMNVNNSLRMLSEQFSYKKSNISIILHTPLDDNSSTIITDSTKVIQVISNLINNAFKFTNEGTIEIGYESKPDFLEFFVRDTGIGIPQEHLNRIFDRFYQVDASGARQYGGTGLGLSICRAYVGLLGGKIWAESKLEEGSVFRFTVPFRKS